MALFGGKKEELFTMEDSVIEFNKNILKIEESNGIDFLVTNGIIGMNRIPLKDIDTVVWGLDGVGINTDLKIVGKGIILGQIKVGVNLAGRLQEWILLKI